MIVVNRFSFNSEMSLKIYLKLLLTDLCLNTKLLRAYLQKNNKILKDLKFNAKKKEDNNQSTFFINHRVAKTFLKKSVHFQKKSVQSVQFSKKIRTIRTFF